MANTDGRGRRKTGMAGAGGQGRWCRGSIVDVSNSIWQVGVTVLLDQEL
jgi:hypothetical protein